MIIKMIINLDKNILRPFRKIVLNALNNKYYRLVFKGGRCSTKSTIAAMIVILRAKIFRHSALCVVRYSNNVKMRLTTQIITALQYLGLSHQFEYLKSTNEFIYLDKNGKRTDVVIYCRGADDPKRLRSIKDASGGFSTLWIEEAADFSCMNDLIDLESSVGRGQSDSFLSIISYNPSQAPTHFLNEQYETPSSEAELLEHYKEDDTLFEYRVDKTVTSIYNYKIELVQCVVHCTYKTLIKEGHIDWISRTDLPRIQLGEKTQSDFYKWWYLGLIVGCDSIVFRNIAEWKFEEHEYDMTYRGLDVGNGSENAGDPWAFTRWYFDSKQRDLYCLDEFKLPSRVSYDDVKNEFKKHNPHNLLTYMDNAVGNFVDHLSGSPYKLNVTRVHKTVEVNSGVQWLRSCNHIYIDPIKCPNTYKEFKEYSYIIDKNGDVTNVLQKDKNHFIDSTRYGLCEILDYGEPIW